MGYSEVFGVMVLMLFLYYIGIIAWDLFHLPSSVEPEKAEEEEIDITDEVNGFATIVVTRTPTPERELVPPPASSQLNSVQDDDIDIEEELEEDESLFANIDGLPVDEIIELADRLAEDPTSEIGRICYEVRNMDEFVKHSSAPVEMPEEQDPIEERFRMIESLSF